MSKLDSLEPGFKDQIVKLLDRLKVITGRTWLPSDCRRSMEQQRVIYTQGRTAPGKVVSNALPGSSAHNFGLAADIWPITEGGDFDWNAPDDLFHIMADEATRMGLVAGYYFHSIHDAPHVESTDWRDKQALWKEGKLKVV